MTFGKAVNFAKYESLSQQEPRLVTLDLASPLGRRLHRRVKLNDDGDLFIVWWSMGDQEVYPWTPQLKVNVFPSSSRDCLARLHLLLNVHQWIGYMTKDTLSWI